MSNNFNQVKHKYCTEVTSSVYCIFSMIWYCMNVGHMYHEFRLIVLLASNDQSSQ